MIFYNKLLESLFEIVKVFRLRLSLRSLNRDGFTKLLVYIYIYIYIYIYAPESDASSTRAAPVYEADG